MICAGFCKTTKGLALFSLKKGKLASWRQRDSFLTPILSESFFSIKFRCQFPCGFLFHSFPNRNGWVSMVVTFAYRIMAWPQDRAQEEELALDQAWGKQVTRMRGCWSKNGGFPPKSWILRGFSIIKFIHFGGNPPIFGNTHAEWRWFFGCFFWSRIGWWTRSAGVLGTCEWFHGTKNHVTEIDLFYRRAFWILIIGKNGGTLGMVPLVINPMYTLYSRYLLGIFPFKGLLGGFKQQGYHPKGTSIFPMN